MDILQIIVRVRDKPLALRRGYLTYQTAPVHLASSDETTAHDAQPVALRSRASRYLQQLASVELLPDVPRRHAILRRTSPAKKREGVQGEDHTRTRRP